LFLLSFFLFFFTATAPTEIYTLSLHDALPISFGARSSSSDSSLMRRLMSPWRWSVPLCFGITRSISRSRSSRSLGSRALRNAARSEEHTSELQSRSDLVCRLLLEKKKKNKIQ